MIWKAGRDGFANLPTPRQVADDDKRHQGRIKAAIRKPESWSCCPLSINVADVSAIGGHFLDVCFGFLGRHAALFFRDVDQGSFDVGGHP